MEKDKLKLILIILVILCIISASSLFKLLDKNKEKDKNERSTVCIKDKCFKVEIANTQETRERGLMFRKGLKEEEGMLFIFQEKGDYPFWMKNTLIPLDIIWINEKLEIVNIKRNATPCESSTCEVYFSNIESLYILEINAGLSDKYDIQEGDKINLLLEYQ